MIATCPVNAILTSNWLYSVRARSRSQPPAPSPPPQPPAPHSPAIGLRQSPQPRRQRRTGQSRQSAERPRATGHRQPNWKLPPAATPGTGTGTGTGRRIAISATTGRGKQQPRREHGADTRSLASRRKANTLTPPTRDILAEVRAHYYHARPCCSLLPCSFVCSLPYSQTPNVTLIGSS
jgi:hypothetical protein